MKSLEERMKSLEDRAREIVGVDGWHPWKFEATENGVLCTGAVCPPVTRGKRRGQPNYSKHDPATLKTVVVPYLKAGEGK